MVLLKLWAVYSIMEVAIELIIITALVDFCAVASPGLGRTHLPTVPILLSGWISPSHAIHVFCVQFVCFLLSR